MSRMSRLDRLEFRKLAGLPLRINEEALDVEAGGPPELPGELEGEFAIPLPEMLARLNSLLEAEYQAWLTYTHYKQMVRGAARNDIAEEFAGHAKEEEGHIDVLARRIVALGGTTSTKVPPVPPASDLGEMIDNIIRQEQVALKRYRDTLPLTGENEGLRQHIETIIEKEQEHTDEIRLLRERA